MASDDILSAIREVSNTKQLDRSELHALLQDGIFAALAKKYGPTVQAEVTIDEAKGEIRIIRLRSVVDAVTDPSREISVDDARIYDEGFEPGDQLEEPIDFAEFGRTAAQAAKQRIIQRVRERERTRIRDEFSGRVGDLLSGEVQQIDREHYHQGEPMRAVLKRIEETPKGPRLILTRADGLFVKALFRLEVPEIQQGIVEIRAVAREVGSRTKIAVFSRDDSIDPVGACVGLKGSRVQAVVNELGGEKIDIVPWSSDPERFAKMALAPARVARVFSDPAGRAIQAVVDEDQLSLAIGRNGQNVRLASELTGWKIDLYSSREWLERGGEAPLFQPLPEESEAADVKLSEIEGLGPATVAVLEDAGYRTLNDIIDLEREDFLRLPGIAPEEADRIMAMIDELTTEEGGDNGAESGAGGSDESAA